jgi:hypothetical protein
VKKSHTKRQAAQRSRRDEDSIFDEDDGSEDQAAQGRNRVKKTA